LLGWVVFSFLEYLLEQLINFQDTNLHLTIANKFNAVHANKGRMNAIVDKMKSLNVAPDEHPSTDVDNNDVDITATYDAAAGRLAYVYLYNQYYF
jgi:hypothetical protein